jgi:hypothetical protein
MADSTLSRLSALVGSLSIKTTTLSSLSTIITHLLHREFGTLHDEGVGLTSPRYSNLGINFLDFSSGWPVVY